MRAFIVAVVALAAAAIVGIATAGQTPAAAVFTAQQATAGRTLYQQNCDSCHMADLGGTTDAPQLAGANFLSTWRARTTKDLFEKAQTMPPDSPNLSEDEYLDVVSFILQSNGAAPGAQPLASTTAAAIGDIAPGRPAVAPGK